MSEITLGGYMQKHDRAAAFGGSDGRAYSVAIYVDDEPDVRGLFGASLLFVCWSPGGDRPVGHVESEILAWGQTPEEAGSRLENLSLYDVKATLDRILDEKTAAVCAPAAGLVHIVDIEQRRIVGRIAAGAGPLAIASLD